MSVKKYIHIFFAAAAFFILFGTLDGANYFTFKRTVIQSGICVSIIGLSALRYKNINYKQ
ncbi:MAG: hypothetical protein GYA50_04755 [Eubacteriaceae bacterium]|nr:hypothetical protein [Eubacteriaceae bacterium]